MKEFDGLSSIYDLLRTARCQSAANKLEPLAEDSFVVLFSSVVSSQASTILSSRCIFSASSSTTTGRENIMVSKQRELAINLDQDYIIL